MNKRRAMLIVAVAAVILAVIGYQAWRLFQVRERLQNFVKSRLEAAFGQQVRFDRVTLGLGMVHLSQVQFSPSKASAQLMVDELSVGFNLLHLFTNGFEPERTATHILLTRPRLLIYRTENRPAAGDTMKLEVPPAPGVARTERPAAARDYSFIDNVTISNGQIVLIDSIAGVSSLIADEVSGWLESQGDGQATARLAGHLFSSDEFDLVVEAGVDFHRNGISYVQANLRNHRLTTSIPFVMPSQVKLLAGRLNGNLRLDSRAPADRGYDIAGHFTLDHGLVESTDGRLRFSDIELDVDVADWNLHIIGARQRCNGSPMTFSGSVYNLTRPRFDLSVFSDSLSLAHVSPILGISSPGGMNGVLRLRATVRDSLSNPRIDGEVTAGELSIGPTHAEQVAAHVTLQDSLLSIRDFHAKIDDVQCRGAGTIRLREPDRPLEAELTAEGNFLALALRLWHLPVTDGYGTVVAQASGPLADPRIVGRFEMATAASLSPAFGMTSSFTYAAGSLQIDANSAPRGMTLQAALYGLGRRPRLRLNGNGMERLLDLFRDPRVGRAFQRYRLEASAEGALDSLNVMLGLADRFRPSPVLRWVGSFIKQPEERQSVGYLRFFPGAHNEFTVRYQGAFRDSTIYVSHFAADPWLSGQLEVGLGGEQRLRGRVKISAADFTRLVEGVVREIPNYAGRFSADLKLGGTLRSPNLLGNLWLNDGVMHGVGGFAIESDIRVDRSGIQLTPLNIQRNGMPFARAAAAYDFGTRQLDLHASAKNIEAADFLRALTGAKDVLRGHASFDVHLSGRGPDYPLYGNIELHDGMLMWFSYDRLFIDFGESATGGNGSFASKHAIHAARVEYEKDGNYRLLGRAVLPLTNHDSLRVALVGDGNFLSVVQDFTEYFGHPRSSGHLEFQLSGTYHDLRLHDSSLQFTDGYMRLGNVAQAITDLSADLFVDSRGEYVELQQLQGHIGDATLTVKNQEAPVKSRQPLRVPFRLFDSDLSLGTLIINSAPNGLLLHIPGLMEAGETGRFIIRGRDDERGFFVAGPWAHPKFRGQVELEGVNFMFPFDASAEPADSVLMHILYNIDYDVRVVSRKDNRYVVKVPSPLDNVYVNIGVDDNISALEFTGVISDSSFRTEGHGESTRGNIEYLDLNFRVEKFGVDFDKNDLWPIVSGRAWTVFTDSTNFPQNIYLSLHTKNEETGEEFSGGRWENVYFKLSSDNPNYGDSQAQILAALGYSLETVGARATEAVGTATDNRLFRPLFRPFERRLERHLGLDIVRLSSRLTRNFIEYNLNLGSQSFESRLALWRNTKLTLGKYLSDDLYFLYNGQIEAGIDYRYQDRGYGLRHILGMEYRVNPTLLLQMELDYNTLLLRDKLDRKLWLRHSFVF